MKSTSQFPAWQPIESAPKDRVILTNSGTAIWWGSSVYVSYRKFMLCDSGGGLPRYKDGLADAEINPTHWMPLPEAPE